MAEKKPISKMSKAELEKLAKKEDVTVEDGMTVPALRDAIRAKREGESDAALATDTGNPEADAATEGDGKNEDDGGDGPQRKVEGQEETQGVGDTTVPQDVKTVPTSTDAERMARSGGDQAGGMLPSGEGKEIPHSEIPPTSGPNDVMNSGEDPTRAEGYTGDNVPPAKTLADGGPEPPQPDGSDEGGKRPLEQTSAPGFKTEGEVAAAKAEASARRKAAREAKKEEAAEKRETGFNPGISVSSPRAVGTQITITGEKFPPRQRVHLELSHSRTSTGTTWLRTDPDGTVQFSLMPSPGKQSVKLTTDDGSSASAEFEVADDPETERERRSREEE